MWKKRHQNSPCIGDWGTERSMQSAQMDVEVEGRYKLWKEALSRSYKGPNCEGFKQECTMLPDCSRDYDVPDHG